MVDRLFGSVRFRVRDRGSNVQYVHCVVVTATNLRPMPYGLSLFCEIVRVRFGVRVGVGVGVRGNGSMSLGHGEALIVAPLHRQSLSKWRRLMPMKNPNCSHRSFASLSPVMPPMFGAFTLLTTWHPRCVVLKLSCKSGNTSKRLTPS
jgi:hypothetical protein